MALVMKTLGLSRGEIVLKDDGTFLTCMAFKRYGVWDNVTLKWAVPPQELSDGERTLAQLKTFVAALT